MPEIVLRGTLGPVGLSSVLHLVEGDMLTGRLVWEGASMAFVHGQLTEVRSGALSGLGALRRAFTQERGEFELSLESELPSEGAMGRMAPLVMDACRVADEWQRLRPLRLAPRGELAPQSENVSRVVAYLDGERPVAQAVGLAGIEPVEITDALLQLWEAGELVEVGAPASLDTLDVGSDLGVDQLVDEARQALRSKDFDTAILYFEAALRREPEHRTLQQNLRRARELAHRN